MLNLIAITSALCLVLEAAIVLKRRWRVGINGPANISVSREWLMHHQTDEP